MISPLGHTRGYGDDVSLSQGYGDDECAYLLLSEEYVESIVRVCVSTCVCVSERERVSVSAISSPPAVC